MKETGIIMSGNHPKLILDGLKNMTRRVIKPQPVEVMSGTPGMTDEGKYFKFVDFGVFREIKCPYGQVGDRLWVRETWAAPFGYDALSPSGLWDKPKVWYYADGDPPKNFGIKRPSIFMPRWASRITLEITEVRVERVQEISLQDCYAEGVRNPVFHKGSIGSDYSVVNVMFPELWDSLNARRGYGWDLNPWVWVISFKLVSQLLGDRFNG